MTETLKCGCTNDGTSWTHMCTEHRNECDAFSVLAAHSAHNPVATTVHRINGKVVSGVEIPAIVKEAMSERPALKPKQEETVKAIKAKVIKTGTKRERAEALYLAAEDKSKATMIAVFMAELEMTPAGAQTYYYAVKGKG